MMSYRTVKHRDLMSEPMDNKLVTDLPGIGVARGGRLNAVGITTPSQLAELYKQMGSHKFESYLDNVCGKNSYWAGRTITALKEYNDKFGDSALQKIDIVTPPKKGSLFDVPQVKNTGQFESEPSTKMASLLLRIQQQEKVHKEFQKEIVFKLKDLKKLSETVQLLQVHSNTLSRTVNAIAEKIESIQFQVSGNENISSKEEDQEDLTEKTRSLEMRLARTEKNVKRLMEEILSKLQQGLKELSTTQRRLVSHIDEHFDAIRKLEEKTRSTDIEIAKIYADQNMKIVLRDKEIADMIEQMYNFVCRVQKLEETNAKLKKSILMCGLCVVFLVVTAFFIFVLR